MGCIKFKVRGEKNGEIKKRKKKNALNVKRLITREFYYTVEKMVKIF